MTIQIEGLLMSIQGWLHAMPTYIIHHLYLNSNLQSRKNNCGKDRIYCGLLQVAFMQHRPSSRKPLVREYPVGETTEVRPNDDSSWSSAMSNESAAGALSPTPVAAPPPPSGNQ